MRHYIIIFVLIFIFVLDCAFGSTSLVQVEKMSNIANKMKLLARLFPDKTQLINHS